MSNVPRTRSLFRALVARALARWGFELRHLSRDPVLAELDRACDTLRLNPGNAAIWQHALSQLALSSHLRDLIAAHQPDLVIDVGANRGQFALHLRALGYSGPIISLEPQRALAESLSAEAGASDPAWTILHGAASDANDELILRTFADDSFSSFHTPSPAAVARFGALLNPTATERVPVRRLDDWLADCPDFHGATRLFLKTDTQGHDLAVLRGAPGALARASLVLAEGSLVPLYDTVATPEALSKFLAPLGLRVAGWYAVSHDKQDLAALELDCLFTRSPR